MEQARPLQKLELAVLQPTSYCNLNCSYCYLPNREITGRMPPSVLESSIRKILTSGLTDSHLIILWHAGEPLVAGLPFYEEAVSLINRYKPSGMRVENSIQTNATLLTDDWCRFISRENFHIGISLDGPESVHDTHRRNWAARGSFRDVMRGVAKLKHHGIEFGVLAVLTADSLPYADEIYEFFKSIAPLSVGFNVEEIENVHSTSTFSCQHSFDGIREAYYSFFARLIERARADPAPLKIREIDQLLKIALRLKKNPGYAWEPMEAKPFRMITVQKNGDVSPFSPEFAGAKGERYANFSVGNIYVQSLEEIAEAVAASLLSHDVEASRGTCERQCKYFQMCGGTYYSNKWSENGNLLCHETLACRLHSQTVIEAFLDQIET